MTERIRQAEFARRCNVTRGTVCKWVKNGRVQVGEDGLLDAQQAMAMRKVTESPLPHHQARKEQIEQEKAESAALSQPENSDLLPAAEKISLKLKRATMKERECKADIAAMERDKMAGSLVERKEVDYVLQDFGHTLRGLLESLPDKLTAELSGYRGDTNKIHVALEAGARELLDQISEHMSRKMARLESGT